MATSEDTARLEARIAAMESTMTTQSGALSASRAEADAHRTELTNIMQYLHDTVVQTSALQQTIHSAAQEPIAEPAEGLPLLPPPGMAGDPLGEQLPWAFWKGKGGGGEQQRCRIGSNPSGGD